MGSFTSDELLYMCQVMNCHVAPELVGVQKRTDIMKILREFIQTETGGNIQGNLNPELRLIARRGVGSKTPKIKESVRGPSQDAAAAAADDDLDQIVTEMVATGSGGNGAGSGDKDGDKDDKKDEEKEADPDYEPSSSDEDEEKVKIIFIHKVPPNPPRKVPVMLPATDTIKEVRSFAAGLFRMKRKDVRMLLKAPEWGEMEMDDDGKTIYDYTVALFTNGCEVEVRFSGVGGAGTKRGRAEDGGVKSNTGIPDIVGEIPALPTDHPAIAAALRIKVINIDGWIKTLNLEKINKIFLLVDEHSTNIAADPALRSYADFTTEMVALKDSPSEIRF